MSYQAFHINITRCQGDSTATLYKLMFLFFFFLSSCFLSPVLLKGGELMGQGQDAWEIEAINTA